MTSLDNDNSTSTIPDSYPHLLSRSNSSSSVCSRLSGTLSQDSDATLAPSPLPHAVSRNHIVYMSSHSHYHFPVHSRIPDRPLIDRVTNEWRSDPRYKEIYDNYEEDEYGQFVISDVRYRRRRWPIGLPRRPHKLLALYFLFLFTLIYVYSSWIKPAMEETDRYDMSIHQSIKYNRKFGSNARPEFTDIVQLQYLDSRNLPGATSSSPKRLIFIGDVQGCKTELLALLQKVGSDVLTDHIIFTGNLVFRGPDSKGVVELARSLGASCVRGNHEDRTLLAYASMHGTIAPVGDNQPTEIPVTKEPTERSAPSSANAGPSEDGVHGDIRHRALAMQLDRDQIEWLQKCPVILNIGRISRGRDYVAVHAGLMPGVPLDKQDPFQVMNMRTIDLVSRVPTELRSGEPWEKLWNHFQKNVLPENQRKTVVYGHDAKRGLINGAYAKGLDSGCVKGGKLSALVVDEKGKEKFFSVKCSKDYTADSWKEELDKLDDEGMIPKMGTS